jgi:hypothetical protein
MYSTPSALCLLPNPHVSTRATRPRLTAERSVYSRYPRSLGFLRVCRRDLAYAGTLAIEFVGDQNDNRSFIKLISLDGQEYASYDTSRLGMTFACYSEPGRFMPVYL